MTIKRLLLLPILGALVAGTTLLGAAPSADDLTRPRPRAAVAAPAALKAMLLGASWAGPRLVAVGEQGVVLLSDDQGRTVRQARTVPLDPTLTSVHFIDASQGWAAGHWGVILASRDGGETWQQQRLDLEQDRPLFALHFFDAEHGVAVGLWSLVLTTNDGGLTWTERPLTPPPGSKRADLNLLSLFADSRGALYATAERGMLLRSDDRGATWRYLSTGYKGSLWSGIALADGTLLVGGQRGSMFRSDDAGQRWTPVTSGSRSSVTAFAERPKAVVAVGLEGLVTHSADGGRSFTERTRSDRLSLTAALVAADGTWVFASRAGIVRGEPAR